MESQLDIASRSRVVARAMNWLISSGSMQCVHSLTQQLYLGRRDLGMGMCHRVVRELELA